MDARHERSQLRAEDRLERSRPRQNAGHLDAHLRQRGRDLATDESHANHQGSSAVVGGFLDRIALAHRPELEDAREVCASEIQVPVLAACGDQQLAECDGPSSIQLDLTHGNVDARGRGSDQLDAVGLVPPVWVDKPARQRLLTA